MSYLEIKNLQKKYTKDGPLVVNNMNLSIEKGEFIVFLGPSGCGKTTTIRMISGLEDISGGEILIDGEDVIGKKPKDRGVSMIFQSYAIWPHMTVFDNIAYPLKLQKVPKDEIKKRVTAAAEATDIVGLLNRYPAQMSGGQRQRVAVSRAIVVKPKIFLMDEPLSNLDAKLRVQMRTVIKKLQRRLGITTIYVTHDQEEALAISDRIAVIKEGEVMQVGSPENIYKKPQNTFVAGFIGVSNFVECDVNGENPKAAVLDIKGECTITCSLKAPFKGEGIISARPEQLFFDEKEGLPGKIVISTFLGDFIEYEIELDNGQTVQLNEYTKDVRELRPDGQRVKVNFDINAVGVYDARTQEVISW